MFLHRRRFLTDSLAAGAAYGMSRTLAAPAIARPANARYSIFDFAGGQALRGKAEATSDFSALITEAVAKGAPIAIPPGRYPFREITKRKRCVSLISDAPVDIACEPGATFVVGQELSGVMGTVFGLQNASQPVPGTETTFRFRGGHFDGSQIAASSNSGMGMISIFQYADPLIEGVSGYGGASHLKDGRGGTGWADTLLATHNCFRERIINLKGIGFFDTALYLSGDNGGDRLDGRGEQAFVSGLEATRCGNGIVMKRDHVGQVIQNFKMTECGNGIIGGAADGHLSNQGKRTHVHDGTLRQIQGRPVAIYGTGVLAANLLIEDFGLQLAEPGRVTGTRKGNEVAGIDLRGAKDGRVVNNTITLKKWLGEDGRPARRRYGIALRSDSEKRPTQGCTISDNRIVGFALPIFVEAGCEENRILASTEPL